MPTEMLQQAVDGRSDIYQKTLPLKPGRYRLNIVAKDIVGGNQTNYEMALDVPRIEDDTLGLSSLILADQIEKLPTTHIGLGPFSIGASKVRPKMDNTFKRDEKLGIYMQLYNFQMDEETKKPKGSVQYEFFKTGTNERIGDPIVEDVATLPGGATQITIEHLLSLKDFAPGSYTLKVKVVDTKRNQTVNQTATFTVS